MAHTSVFEGSVGGGAIGGTASNTLKGLLLLTVGFEFARDCMMALFHYCSSEYTLYTCFFKETEIYISSYPLEFPFKDSPCKKLFSQLFAQYTF